MKICTDHWAQLRQQLQDKGLLTGDETGHPQPSVMRVNRDILARFVNVAPPHAMMGDVCPLCYAGKVQADLDTIWIGQAVEDEACAEAKKMSSSVVH